MRKPHINWSGSDQVQDIQPPVGAKDPCEEKETILCIFLSGSGGGGGVGVDGNSLFQNFNKCVGGAKSCAKQRKLKKKLCQRVSEKGKRVTRGAPRYRALWTNTGTKGEEEQCFLLQTNTRTKEEESRRLLSLVKPVKPVNKITTHLYIPRMR